MISISLSKKFFCQNFIISIKVIDFYRGMLKYMINYALYLVHYDAHFHINDDAKKCRYLVSQIISHFFIIHLNISDKKYCKKYVKAELRVRVGRPQTS